MKTCLEHAHYYAGTMGWHVFPAPPGEKKSHKSAQYSGGRTWGATRDAAEITADFIRWSDANIGVVTGANSGIFVVEADTPEGHAVDGIAALAALEAAHGALPPTLEAESPSGSIHRYFRHPGFPVKNSASVLAPGVDVRGDGGMVLAPPSVKPEKGAYRWRNSLPIADAPAWLLALVKGIDRPVNSPQAVRAAPEGLRPATGSQADQVLRSACEAVAAAGPGVRNAVLNESAFKVGRYVAAGEIARDVAFADLLNACDECGLTADDGEDQCLATINSGLGGGAKDPAKTTQVMFAGIPATVSPPAGTAPMVGGTQAVVDLGTPVVAAFNAAHLVAHSIDAPILPLDLAAAPLRGPLNEALGKLITLAERDRGALRFDTFGDLLGVLSAAHPLSVAPIIARIRSAGTIVADGRLKRAVAEFENAVMRATRTGNGWHLGPQNKPDPNVSENVDVMLEFRGTRLRFNRWISCIEYDNGDGTWRKMQDAEIDALLYFARSADHRFNVGKDFLRSCLNAISRRMEIDPAADRINSLVWDGVPRLDTWLTRACGVPADAYHAAVGRNLIGGIVKRLRHPGCRHDEMVVLISPEQGRGKSTLCKILALDPDWHIDNLDLNKKDTDLLPSLSGKLIIEFGEMANWSRRSANRIKQFVTTVNDNFTKKFEAFATDQYRRCIFIGTTNDIEPLKDETGNRRFLPVHVAGEVDLEWMRLNVEQILAEAAHLEVAGEDFSIPRSVWSVAGEQQEAARSLSAEEELVAQWFAVPPDGRPRYVVAADLGDALRHARLRDNAKLSSVFKKLGYEASRPYINGVQIRVWTTAEVAITDAVQWRHVKDGPNVRWTLRQPVSAALCSPPPMPAVLAPPPY